MCNITKEQMKEEAMKRMKMLDFHPNVLKDFKGDRLNYSDYGIGILYWVEGIYREKIKEWELETGNLVYHAIHSRTEFGELLTLLYVSKDSEEWKQDQEDLKEGYPLAYVMNLTNECFSEYGSIGIKCMNGGLVRWC